MRTHYWAAGAVGLAVMLAGCGGGGGGGGSSAGGGGGAGGGGSVPVDAGRLHGVVLNSFGTVTDRTVAGGVDVALAGGPSAMALTTTGATLTGRAIPSASMTGTNPSNSVVWFHDNSQAGLLTMPMTDSAFGLYTTTTAAGTLIAGVHEGTLTPTTSLPSGVSATYSGGFMGVEVDGGTPYAVVGSSTLTADFGAGTVGGSVSNIVYTSTSLSGLPTGYGLSMNGTISGSTYAGTVGFTGGGVVTTSAMSGAFYGANADETAGALRVEGIVPAYGSIAVVGGFGGVTP